MSTHNNSQAMKKSKKPVLKRLTISSLKMNKKRTIVTIIGIILATALITAVASMAASFQQSLISYEKKQSGDYHYVFYKVPNDELKYIENNPNVESYFKMQQIGYAMLEGSANPDKPYLYLEAMDKTAMENATVHIVEGRLPENNKEVLISKHIKSNGGVDYKVGDMLTLSIGDRKSIEDQEILNQQNPYTYEEETLEPFETQTFTVVGITERLSYEMEDRMAPGYTVITYLDTNDSDELSSNQKETDIYVTYTKAGLKNRNAVTAGILGVDEEMYLKAKNVGFEECGEMENYFNSIKYVCNENIYLIRYETLDFSDSTFRVLYSVVAIVMAIIVATSAFCIRNSFAISITEKMKQYGMLASIGATPSQIKKNVFYEAFVLALIGIPIGCISGVFACWAVITIINTFLPGALNVTLIFNTSAVAILFAIILAVIMIFLSAAKPARRASHVSPIVAMNGTEDIKVSSKRVSAPKYVKNLFGIGGTIAYKNMKRNRKKYRVSMISIAVSVTVFLSLYSFMQLLFRSTTYYIGDTEYNISIRATDGKNDLEELKQISKNDLVERASIIQRADFEVPDKEVPYTEESLKLYPEEYRNDNAVIVIYSVGDAEYERFIKQLGLNTDEVGNKAILVNDSYSYLDGKHVAYSATKYKAGDIIKGNLRTERYLENDEDNTQKFEVELATVTDIHPLGMKVGYSQAGNLVVSDTWMEQHSDAVLSYMEGYYVSSDADALQEVAEKEFSISTGSIINIDKEQREQKSLGIVIAIFLYGFIIVIMLIGITNIFNTITTSMELRSREFAMLRSIGMTRKEFHRMVRLESLFYGTKALVIGLILGTGLSYLIYNRLAEGMDVGYQLPVTGILISIVAVFALLWAIMQYSISKISRQNIIETIREENI